MGETPFTSEVKYEQDANDPTYVPLDKWYKKGVKQEAAHKYRKGACENCGAITHKTKDCLERPRKVGAKYTNRNIAHDEYIGQLNGGSWDARRDIWNGYDPSSYKRIIDDWNKMDQQKREFINKKVKLEDKAEYEEKPGYVNPESKMSVTSTDLRIREDTAKYLRNLDENSPFYNGKTR